MSYYSTLIFDGVIEEDGETIYLDKFMTVAREIPKFCEALGTTFYLVKKDVDGNLLKLGDTMKLLPPNSTVKALIQFELDNKTAKNGNSGTTGLLWLRRGMWFIYAMLQNMVVEEREGKDDNLKGMTREAYERTLRQHHNALIAPMIKACFNALPRRSVLLKSLSNGVPMEQELAEMDQVIASLGPVLELLKKNLVDFNFITDPSKD